VEFWRVALVLLVKNAEHCLVIWCLNQAFNRLQRKDSHLTLYWNDCKEFAENCIQTAKRIPGMNSPPGKYAESMDAVQRGHRRGTSFCSNPHIFRILTQKMQFETTQPVLLFMAYNIIVLWLTWNQVRHTMTKY
jgi:hypothetical protein